MLQRHTINEINQGVAVSIISTCARQSRELHKVHLEGERTVSSRLSLPLRMGGSGLLGGIRGVKKMAAPDMKDDSASTLNRRSLSNGTGVHITLTA